MNYIINNKISSFKTPLTLFEKFIVFFLLLFIYRVPDFFGNILGIVNIQDEIFFWFIPSLLFFTSLLINKKPIYVPKLILFILLILYFVASEFKVFRGFEYQPQYNYSIGLFKFYSIFSIFYLIEKNNSLLNFIIKYSEIFISIIIFYFYLDYIISGSSGYIISNNKIDLTDRYFDSIDYHINGLAIIAASGVFISIFRNYIYNYNLNYTYIKIIYFSGIVFITSSRGVFILILLMILIFIFRKWNFNKILFYMILILLISSLLIYNGFYNEIIVLRRLINFEGTGRITQFFVSFNNFIENPFFGVGQSLAGYDYYLNTTRSNVHYTQVLGSYGIFISIVYFYFIFSLFGPIRKKINLISIISLMFIFIIFLAYNWNLILPISVILYLNQTSLILKSKI